MSKRVLAPCNRERIVVGAPPTPSRQWESAVHARGGGAYGHFEVTDDVTGFPHADFPRTVGRRTEVLLRFSTVADSLGGADTVRDPRGSAVKFYREDGSHDLIGNNTPAFFIKDPIKFPDVIHSRKRDPFTGRQEPDNARNYEPNSYDGPAQTGRPLSAPPAVTGHPGTHEAPLHTKDDDFSQAGELYRLMSAEEQRRLVANIAGSLSQVSRDDVIEKNLAHFHAADPEYGRRVAEAVRALRED